MSKLLVALIGLLVAVYSTPHPASAADQVIEPPTNVITFYDLCAHGLNDDVERPFTKNARVKLSLRGAAPSTATLKTLQAELIRQALWQEQASRVYVEDVDEQGCPGAYEGVVELTVALSPDSLAELEGYISRDEHRFRTLLQRLIKDFNFVISKRPKSTEGDAKTWLRVFYATNRQAISRRGDAVPLSFGSERHDRLSYGEIEVAVQSQSHMRNNESSAILRLDKVSELDSFSINTPPVSMARDAWVAQLRQKAAKFEKPGILLFVHGYNVDFLDSAKRAAQLSYDLAFPGPTVFFSWPSDATTIQYLRDGRDAENSWSATAKLLSDLVEALPNGPIYVIAHSMGNRVLLGGLASLFDESIRSRRAFREIVLAAPDIDQDYYRLNWSKRIQNRGPRLTLYASSHDLALASSEFLNGGVRLGVGGSSLYLDFDIDSVDASNIKREFFGLNHSYFGDSQTVLSDIFFLIRQGLDPDKRPYLKRIGPSRPYRWEFR